MSKAIILEDIMRQIAENRERNISTHRQFCRHIITNDRFKFLSDHEKQHTIDLLHSVMKGTALGIIEDNLQMSPGSIKGIFDAAGIDIEAYGKQLYREGDEKTDASRDPHLIPTE